LHFPSTNTNGRSHCGGSGGASSSPPPHPTNTTIKKTRHMIHLRKMLSPYALALLAATPIASAANEPSVYVQPVLPSMPPDNNGGARAHVGYSAAMGAIGTVLAPEHKWWVLAGCITIGAAKELRDRNKGQPGYQHGLFSRKDLRADAAGCLAGVGVVTLYRKEF
jgi:hypothetical protein